MTLRSRAFVVLALLLSWTAPVFGSDRSAAAAEIRRLLADQVDAWNRGDLVAFVAAYDEQALFVTGEGTTRGRAEVLARYESRYADLKAMGKLALDVEELRLTGGAEIAGARVLAKWTLAREGAAPRSGPTLIILERRDGRWWITEDASMESPAKK